mmetsp:Transcript_47963/g.58076  ORF Transcript_47963/g.58076 Transcript_47963/m.58076 type:complete len:678 (+) Transcript_47963:54-2087(+)|eukprot:CAMPEP_0172507276 /NCGR_PEP_ID=MMETSP1066-20121228/202747_1 /TAXON_ID=671091 /ORGANISM="Coscinodiscus wailesii, Strain CCMP2513" /LENGTH=677 /DNA_ID=CAMNT_0013284775 /DNA_START=47 /DNA_END=2080 /DNA_ORIENTATION=+
MPYYVRTPIHNTIPGPNETATSSPPPPPEEDDEGLYVSGYDVIICGTNLVHAILASALSLAGKTVLHCDGSDTYGAGDATYPLKGLMEWVECKTKGQNSVIEDDVEKVEGGTTLKLHPLGRLGSLHIHDRSRVMDEDTLDVGTSVITSYGKGIIKSRSNDQAVVSLTSWKLANDIHPTLFIPLEQSQTETPKIQSTHHYDVHRTLSESRSFALDLTPYLLLGSSPSISRIISSGVADYLCFKSLLSLRIMKKDAKTKTTRCQLVPCSKGDVFQTTLLNPMEKRKLMKLLRAAGDYGAVRAEEVETVERLNETKLSTGRSLSRPQNKSVGGLDLEKFEKEEEGGEMRFDEYLTAEYKLSDALKVIVIHALAMVEEGCGVREGMMGLYRHLESLGKFGGTAFLCPMYGSGELTQAFCRCSAVNGGVYLLRRTPLQINTSDSTLLIGPDPDPTFGSNEVKSIPYRNIVTSEDAIVNKKNNQKKRILRRISVIRNNPKETEEERYFVTLPPQTVRNDHPIQCLVLDQSTSVAARGYAVVQLSMVVDEADPAKVDHEILREALLSLLACQERDCDEIHFITFSVGSPSDDVLDTDEETNVYISKRPKLSLTVDAAFDQAEAIFKKICPDEEFLLMSQERKKQRMAQMGNEENDEEKEVLESALSMIDAGKVDNAVETEGGNP